MDQFLNHMYTNKGYSFHNSYYMEKYKVTYEVVEFIMEAICETSDNGPNILKYDKSDGGHYAIVDFYNYKCQKFINNGGFKKYFSLPEKINFPSVFTVTSTKSNSNSDKSMNKKEVFVTYSWDDEEHKDRIISFTEELRKNGFHAEMDRLRSQMETATDFSKMMHQAITDYDKVIVVLSKGYKIKAEGFNAGVGKEYGMIIKDIDISKNKYILVCFEPITNEITPLEFRSRHVLDLTKSDNYNDLFAKLKNENLIEFSEVALEKPIIQKKVIQRFELNDEKIEVVKINSIFDGSSQFYNLYQKIDFKLQIELKNDTIEGISDYNIEIHYPLKLTNYDVAGRIEGEYKICLYEKCPKIFPGQSKNINLENVSLTHSYAEKVLKDTITVKVYSDKGLLTEKKFPVEDVLLVNNGHGNEKLTGEMFSDGKNW